MSARQLSIVIVDDDASVLKSLARLLRSAGYEITSFDSPQDCLNSWPFSPTDCFVVDVQMPEINGFELMARLRQQGCKVPAIFITAHDTPRARTTASQCGTGLLIKPFNEDNLLLAVAKAVQWPEANHLPGGTSSLPKAD